MTGQHETSSMDRFTWGIGDRGASVRISRLVEANKKGYFEDRRPASNLNPYEVINLLIQRIL